VTTPNDRLVEALRASLKDADRLRRDLAGFGILR